MGAIKEFIDLHWQVGTNLYADSEIIDLFEAECIMMNIKVESTKTLEINNGYKYYLDFCSLEGKLICYVYKGLSLDNTFYFSTGRGDSRQYPDLKTVLNCVRKYLIERETINEI